MQFQMEAIFFHYTGEQKEQFIYSSVIKSMNTME